MTGYRQHFASRLAVGDIAHRHRFSEIALLTGFITDLDGLPIAPAQRFARIGGLRTLTVRRRRNDDRRFGRDCQPQPDRTDIAQPHGTEIDTRPVPNNSG